MNNYSITFKSLRAGTVYTLNIGGGTGAAIPLKGGAQPFTTQEDDSDDMFTPIRTQTGYIRIRDDGLDARTPAQAFNWKDLLPATDTSRPVTLTGVDAQGNSLGTLWQGFIQAQNFGGTLYGNPQEREFPVQCPLTALSASDVDATNRELRNFAYIIKQAFDNLTGITINNFIFQGGTKAQDMLLKLVDWQNLVSENNGVISGRYDNLQVLTDVCAFWGWTCRTCGQNVYFTCADDATLMSDALILSYAQLGTMAGGVAAGSTSETFLSNVSPSGEIFASVNNEDYQVRGYQKATVSADGNSASSEIFKAFPESVEETMEGMGYYTETHSPYTIVYSNDLMSFTSPFMNGTATSNRGSFNLMKIMKLGQEPTIKDVIRIKRKYSSSLTCATLQTTFQHVYVGNTNVQFGRFPSGIKLTGVAYREGERYNDYSDTTGMGKKSMYMCLGIGPSGNIRWWNGQSWSTTKSSFQVTLGNEGDVMWSFYMEGGLRVSSQIIPLAATPALYGQIYVELLGSDDMPYNDDNFRAFELADFSIELAYDNTLATVWGEKPLDSVREYKATNSRAMDAEWNADLIYATDDNLRRGYGLVINPSDHTIMTTYAYDGTNGEHPEQHLANRVVYWGASAKRKIYAELLTNLVGTITPRNTVTLDSITGHAISISHDWRDDITQLTTMQV